MPFLNLFSADADTLVTAIWDEGGRAGVDADHRLGGRLMLPERFPDTVQRHGIIDIRAASGASVHVIALRMSPEGVFNLLPQSVELSRRGEKLT